MIPAEDAFGPWADGYGRVARKLRVSVTDRCDLRCVYCMPARPSWLPKEDVLSYEELARIVSVAVRCGVDRVRVTGGEPLLRRDLPRFIAQLKATPGLREVALTTNGTRLASQAGALKEAGLERVTVSLDSLDPDRYRRLARADGLRDALRGIDAAEAAGLGVKVNVVVVRGVNDAEVPELAAWGRAAGRHLRFIEFMPLEGDGIWSRDLLVPAEEILAAVSRRFPLRERGPRGTGETSAVYDYADGRGSIGVIASVTRAFCGDCDRVRLTADGSFRTCLFASGGADLRGPLRRGASDEALARLMAGAVLAKQPGHLISLPGFRRPDRAMNAIGG